MAERNLLEEKEEEVAEVVAVPQSEWSQLLPELLSWISLHVFRKGDVGVVALIPSICKFWNYSFNINYTITLIRRSLSDPPPDILAPEYPCLITILKGSLCKFYHPNHTFTMNFPELSGFYIKFSKFGWLLLCSKCRNSDDYSYAYFFFNPFTRQKINLPTSNELFRVMSFSSPPTSSDCFVVGITYDDTFGIIKRGEQNWEFHDRSLTIGDHLKPFSHLTICGDQCYAIGTETITLVFDLKEKSTYLLDHNPLGSLTYINIKGAFLVEDEDGAEQLLAVMVPCEEKNILIRKMDLSKREWLPVETLRNKMLFVSKTSSMLKPAPVKAASNKIYFPKILNDDTFIPYDLANKKYVSVLGERDYANKSPLSANVKVKQWSNCAWIETMPFAPVSACNQQIDW